MPEASPNLPGLARGYYAIFNLSLLNFYQEPVSRRLEYTLQL